MYPNQPLPNEDTTGDILDSSFEPTLPVPPETIFDWPGYFYEILVYVFQMAVYLLRSLLVGINTVISSLGNFNTAIHNTLSFLPSEILTTVTVSIVAILILKILKKVRG